MKPNLTALIRSAIATIWLTVAGSIAAEFSPALKAWFTSVGGQHWTGKSIVAVAVFAILYLLQLKTKEVKRHDHWIAAVTWSAVWGGIAIFTFFVWHFIDA